MIRPGQSPETVFGENNNLPFAGVGKWLITKLKMSKSEEYIEIKSFVVVNPNFPVITKESALKAVAMAEEEMKRKAIEVLSSVLDNWVHGGDADCIIAEFEERLNIG